jgi:dihydroorotate dehydrogenase (fumarate)
MLPMSNAAGWLKRPADVEEILKVPSDIVSSVTLGSYTLLPREGNPGKTFWDDNENSLNALGLPNPGIEEVRRFFPELAKKIRASGKRVRLSIAGFSVEEYRELARIAVGLRPDEIEWNLGCPNVRKDGVQKPILAFDPDAISTILTDAHRVSGTLGEPDVAIKLSPYSDPFFLARVAEVLAGNMSGYEKLVICNTFPNASGYDDRGNPVISANDGFGGLGGCAMKHIALGQIRQFRKRLRESTRIIGVGGISGGMDVRDFQLAGANEVQVGTAFFLRGARTFQGIALDMVDSNAVMKE